MYKINLYSTFDLWVLDTPRKRRLGAEEIFQLLGLTPEKHVLDGSFSTLGEFWGEGGDIERLAKRHRKTFDQLCVACEADEIPDITALPEYNTLLSYLPSPQRIPKISVDLSPPAGRAFQPLPRMLEVSALIRPTHSRAAKSLLA